MLGNLQPLSFSLPWWTSGPKKVIFHLMEMCLLTGHKLLVALLVFYGGISWSANIIFSNNLFPLFYVSVPGLGIDFLYQLLCTGLSLFIKTSFLQPKFWYPPPQHFKPLWKRFLGQWAPSTFDFHLFKKHTKVLYITVFQKKKKLCWKNKKRNPPSIAKGFLISTKFRGSSSHFRFDHYYIVDFHSTLSWPTWKWNTLIYII